MDYNELVLIREKLKGWFDLCREARISFGRKEQMCYTRVIKQIQAWGEMAFDYMVNH